MHDESWLTNAVATSRSDRSTVRLLISGRAQLGGCRFLENRCVTICFSRLEALNVGSPSPPGLHRFE
jgi:hypothetical protein